MSRAVVFEAGLMTWLDRDLLSLDFVSDSW